MIKTHTEIDVDDFVLSIYRAELDEYTLNELVSFIKGVRCTLFELGVDDDTISKVRSSLLFHYFPHDD